jgi:hypothetical protein
VQPCPFLDQNEHVSKDKHSSLFFQKARDKEKYYDIKLMLIFFFVTVVLHVFITGKSFQRNDVFVKKTNALAYLSGASGTKDKSFES